MSSLVIVLVVVGLAGWAVGATVVALVVGVVAVGRDRQVPVVETERIAA